MARIEIRALKSTDNRSKFRSTKREGHNVPITRANMSSVMAGRPSRTYRGAAKTISPAHLVGVEYDNTSTNDTTVECPPDAFTTAWPHHEKTVAHGARVWHSQIRPELSYKSQRIYDQSYVSSHYCGRGAELVLNRLSCSKNAQNGISSRIKRNLPNHTPFWEIREPNAS